MITLTKGTALNNLTVSIELYKENYKTWVNSLKLHVASFLIILSNLQRSVVNLVMEILVYKQIFIF